MPENSYRSASRLVIGVAVMGLGILFTLDNLGIASAGAVLRWWPAILIYLGVIRLAGFGRGRRSPGSGAVLTVLGSWWLLHNLGVVNRGIGSLWPLLLVFLGVAIIRRGYWGFRSLKFGYVGSDARRFGKWPPDDSGRGEDFKRASSGGTGDAPPAGSGSFVHSTPAGTDSFADPAAAGTGERASTAPDAEPANPMEAPGGDPAGAGPGVPPPVEPVDPSAVLKVDVFMSSVARKVASQRFQGGEVTAIMGGGDIDLRSARMAGEVARLEIDLVMGGINLFIPEDWVVEYQGTPIMGGVEDTSRHPAGHPAGRLVVTGTLLWSAIVIKN